MAFKIGTTTVADPAKGGVEITDEPMWSENTGRNVKDGKMVGDIVAWKKTVQITWPPLSFTDVSTLISAIKNAGAFFDLTYYDTSATTPSTIKVYSGSPQRTIESINAAYRKQTGVTVTFIEQ